MPTEDPDLVLVIQKLKTKAQFYLDKASEIAVAAGINADIPLAQHNTLEGRRRISEANKRLWILCVKCGKRHRRTHEHIVAQVKTEHGKRRTA